jgi:hypothetical protein
MSTRFKMSFGNQTNQQSMQPINTTQPSINHSLGVSNKQLNYSMIHRVHKAKSGCSACGKKVM